MAVHPTYPLNPAGWRLEQGLLHELVARQRPDLVIGDLNATLDHRPLRRVLALGYDDAAEQSGSGWQPTWPANGDYHGHHLPLPPAVAIDHVLTGRRLLATQTRTAQIDGTDHLALLAEVTVRAPAG